MKFYWSALLIAVLMFFSSCNKSKAVKNKSGTQDNRISKNSNTLTAQTPEHTIDLNKEAFSIEDLMKIDEEIPVLGLVASEKADTAWLRQISDLQMLNYLDLSRTSLEGLDLIHLKKCKTLKELDLSHMDVEDDAIKSLIGTSVEKVVLTGLDLTSEAIGYMKMMKSLKTVVLADSDNTELKSAVRAAGLQLQE